MFVSDFVVRDDEHGYDYVYTEIDPTSDDAEKTFGEVMRMTISRRAMWCAAMWCDTTMRLA